MALGDRDRRALQLGAAALALWVLLRFAIFPLWDQQQQARAELPRRETALIEYRQAVTAAGSERQRAESLAQRLRANEQGLLQSTTAALAAAELQDWVRQMMADQAIDIRASEFLAPRPQADGYSQVPLGLQVQCRLDQLVNVLAQMRTGPKIIAIPRLLVQSTGTPEKMLNVQMTLAGVMRAPGTAGSAAP